MNAKTLFTAGLTFVRKHKTTICVVGGVVAMGAGTILMINSRTKAETLLSEVDEKYESQPTEEPKTKANYILDKGIALAKSYGPGALAWTTGAFLVMHGHKMDLKSNAVLGAAYSLAEKRLTTYQEKVKETFGEKKEQKVRDDIYGDIIKNSPPQEGKIIQTSSGQTLCYDEMSGRYFTSDIEFIRKTQNRFNQYLLSDGYKSLNDFYEMIGLKSIPIGDDYGWAATKELMDLSFSAQLSDNETPCLVICYNSRPYPEYFRYY